MNRNPLVSIAGTIGGICIGIVAIFLVFAPSQVSVAAWIVAILAAMGVALGFLASKASTDE